MSDSRLEKFIYAICSMDVTDLPVPLSRIEKLWNCLITGETPDFEPLSRNEKYLMAMLDRYDISNLPAPMSRGEKLLYKIAVGETDLSDVPGYLSRYEELLKYLIENGGISGGDFEYVLYTLNQSLSTLYTTAEKPVKKAIIYGDTLVNTLQESSSLAITPMGEDIDAQQATITGTANGVIQKATIKGHTKLLDELGNECEYPNVLPITTKNAYIDTNNGNEIATETSFNTTFVKCPTVDFVIKGNNRFRRIVFYDNNKTFISGISGLKSDNSDVIVNSSNIPSNAIYIRISASISDSNPEIAYTPDKKLFIKDVNGNNLYITHLESVKAPAITMTGKNLWKHGDLTNFDTYYDYNYVMSPGTYYISGEQTITYDAPVAVAFRDKNNNVLGLTSLNGTITISETTYQIAIYSNGHNYAASTGKRLSVNNFMIEKASTATSYEPYQSITLSTPEDLELCKVGDVEDELNCSTGEVTQRIGEVILDGSDDERWRVDEHLPNNYKYLIPLINVYYVEGRIFTTVVSNKFPSINNGNSGGGGQDVESVCINGWAQGNLNLSISKTKLNNGTINELREYLSQNPITVQYQLATPTTKTVPLIVQDQDGNTVPHLQAFNETTHISTSSTGLIPNVVIPATVSYPSIIKPSTLYTVKLKRSVTSGTLMINVGGTEQAVTSDCFTITTPSTLTSQDVIFSGKGNVISEVTVVKGDQTAKEYGYFDGMESVKINQVKTTGKNLFDGTWEDGHTLHGNGDIKNTTGARSLSSFIKVNNSFTFYSTPILVFRCYDEYKNDLNGDSNSSGLSSGLLELKSNTKYIRVVIDTSNINNKNKFMIVTSEEDLNTYETNQSNTLTINEDLELRKVGDVRDELDAKTGEVIERVGEIKTNNIINEITIMKRYTDKLIIRLPLTLKTTTYPSNRSCPYLLCDKLKTLSFKNAYADNTEIGVYVHDTNTDYIYMCILNSNLVSNDLDGIKKYLKANPSTIQYKLLESTVKTVDLTVVDQDNQPTQLGTLENVTHVSLEAENLIPTLEMEVATRISKELASASPLMDDISMKQEQLNTTVDEQSNNVDATMIATTEIYEETL